LDGSDDAHSDGMETAQSGGARDDMDILLAERCPAVVEGEVGWCCSLTGFGLRERRRRKLENVRDWGLLSLCRLDEDCDSQVFL
jgi:hypothetical protein